MRSAAGILVLIAGLALADPVAARPMTLERWIDSKLEPYLDRRLGQHPRFAGENVSFVVFDAGKPAAVSNALALDLRERLHEAALANAGITVVAQPGRGAITARRCASSDADYLVGIEVTRELDGRHAVSLAALDIAQQEWVGGFGISWTGHLTAAERRAFRDRRTDPALLGGRDAPFDSDQADLLAEHLARQLACALHRQTSGDYVITDRHMPTDGGTRDRDHAVGLVANHLLRADALRLALEPADANAELTGAAFPVDEGLVQYWVRLEPADGADRPALGVSAYLRRDDAALGGTPAPGHATRATAAVTIGGNSSRRLLAGLALTPPAGISECRERTTRATTFTAPGSGRCSILRADANADVIVFLLHHQAAHGLVRTSAGCRQRTPAHVVVAGDLLRLPVAAGRVAGTPTPGRWPVEPGVDTYYVIAVGDSALARRVASHLDRLPVRCGKTLRPGLAGSELAAWLDELAMLVASSAGRIEWRGLPVDDML